MLNRAKHTNELYIWLEVCCLFKVEVKQTLMSLSYNLDDNITLTMLENIYLPATQIVDFKH